MTLDADTPVLAGLTPVGVAVSAADGDGLRCWSAPGALTPDLRDALTRAKPLLLAALPLCGPGAWAEVYGDEDDEHHDEYSDIHLADVLDAVADEGLREHLRFIYEERAGIAQYDGGLSRAEAERVALGEVRAELGAE